MEDLLIEHLISVVAIWSYGIATLIVGYLFARLGYDLFLRGAKGEFTFSLGFKGAKADLASASPGLFFIFMGAAIVAVGLYKGMTIEISKPGPTVLAQPVESQAREPQPPLREFLPNEEGKE